VVGAGVAEQVRAAAVAGEQQRAAGGRRRVAVAGEQPVQLGVGGVGVAHLQAHGAAHLTRSPTTSPPLSRSAPRTLRTR
jgi:hypothetical protein